MSSTLIERRKDTLIVHRLTELEKDVEALKVNQQKILTFGNIILDSSGNGSIATVGGNTVDGNGLVSTVNFSSASLFNNAVGPITTTSTSLVDVPGTSLASVTFSRDTRVLYFIMAIAYVSSLFHDTSTEDQVEVTMHDSVTGNAFVNVLPYGLPVTVFSSGDQWWYPEMMARTAIRTETAGTHTYNLQWRTAGPNGGTSSLFAYEFGYLVLGT